MVEKDTDAACFLLHLISVSEKREEQCDIYLPEPCQNDPVFMYNLMCLYDVEKESATCQCSQYYGFNSTSGRCAGKYSVVLYSSNILE